MKSTTLYKSLLALAAPFMLAACSNDSEVPENPVNEPFEGIVLNIPTADMAQTRGTTEDDGKPTTEEAKIHTLTVIAYPITEGSGQTATVQGVKTVYEWTAPTTGTDPINPAIANTYKNIQVKIKKGKYHIYVLANTAFGELDFPTGNTATDFEGLEESMLQNATLKSTKCAPGTLDTSKGLPMSADYTVMKESSNASSPYANGVVEIKSGESTDVYADLTFCVAKVRFTMLNGTTPDIKMSGAWIKYYPTNDGLIKDVASLTSNNTLTLSTSEEGTELTGSLYKYPTDITEDDEEEDWTRTTLTDTEEATAAKWAWQGIWYIPEHIFASGATTTQKSTLDVKFSVSSTNKSLELGKDSKVERANFYDMLGYIQAKEVAVKVKVNNWSFHKTVYELDEDGNVVKVE